MKEQSSLSTDEEAGCYVEAKFCLWLALMEVSSERSRIL